MQVAGGAGFVVEVAPTLIVLEALAGPTGVHLIPKTGALGQV